MNIKDQPVNSESSVQLPLNNERRFQEHWKKLYKWIIYDNIKDKVFCSVCKKAVENNIVLPTITVKDKTAKDAFVDSGFSGWRKALERFKIHEG